MAGRPTDYDPSYVAQAIAICRAGATIEEVADSFSVNRATIYRWANRYPEFCNAIKAGKEPADDRVERSLYQRACGYSTTEAKREYEFRTVEGQAAPVRVLVKETVHEKHVAPDVAAAFIWLKNRRPEDWRDRKEFTGQDGEPLVPRDATGALEMARRVAFLLHQADESVKTTH